MKWQSPSPANRAISLIRPLLDFPKAELLAFARENKIPFRDDATNFSSDFLRNRIRNELLPLLRKNYQPGLDKAVLRLMEIVGAEAEFAGEAARKWLKIGRADLPVSQDARQRVPTKMNFDKLPIAIQRRVLQSQLTDAGVAPDFDLIESLRQSADCFVSVGPNVSVSRDKSGNIKSRTEPKLGFSANELVVNLLNGKGEAIFDGVKLCWQIGLRGRSPHRDQEEVFDANKVGGEIILRHWRPGDRFQPIGMKSAAKLQDLFVNAKIPAACRRGLVLATTAAGEIFWVEGLRIGENFKLTPATKACRAWRWVVENKIARV
jgi:tRNA(Ile)-lysidine synthase